MVFFPTHGHILFRALVLGGLAAAVTARIHDTAPVPPSCSVTKDGSESCLVEVDSNTEAVDDEMSLIQLRGGVSKTNAKRLIASGKTYENAHQDALSGDMVIMERKVDAADEDAGSREGSAEDDAVAKKDAELQERENKVAGATAATNTPLAFNPCGSWKPVVGETVLYHDLKAKGKSWYGVGKYFEAKIVCQKTATYSNGKTYESVGLCITGENPKPKGTNFGSCQKGYVGSAPPDFCQDGTISWFANLKCGGRFNYGILRQPKKKDVGTCKWVKAVGSGTCAICEGDCNSDRDCKDGNTCYQTSKGKAPGCAGALDDKKTDVCVARPLPKDGTKMAFDRGNDGCTKDSPCSECSGDCDSDEDCRAGLKCHKTKDGYKDKELLKHCTLYGKKKNHDWCIKK